MAINYEPVGWDTTKHFNPTNMNHMDGGIKAACDKVDKHDSEIAEINSNLSQKKYTVPTIKSERATEVSGGFVKIGSLVIVNFAINMNVTVETNYTNPLNGFPTPVNSKVQLYCANVTNTGTLGYITGKNFYINKVSSGNVVNVMGAYITSD